MQEIFRSWRMSIHGDDGVTLVGNFIEKVAKFLYLEDVISSESEVQEAAITRKSSGWQKFENAASV